MRHRPFAILTAVLFLASIGLVAPTAQAITTVKRGQTLDAWSVDDNGVRHQKEKRQRGERPEKKKKEARDKKDGRHGKRSKDEPAMQASSGDTTFQK